MQSPQEPEMKPGQEGSSRTKPQKREGLGRPRASGLDANRGQGLAVR